MVIKQNHMSKNLSEIHMWLTQKFIFSFSASLHPAFFPSVRGMRRGESYRSFYPLYTGPLFYHHSL